MNAVLLSRLERSHDRPPEPMMILFIGTKNSLTMKPMKPIVRSPEEQAKIID